MKKQKSADGAQRVDTELKIPSNLAMAQLNERMQKGYELKKVYIKSKDELAAAEKEYRKWNAYNTELLKRIFTTDEFSSEYSWWPGIAVGYTRTSLAQEILELHEKIDSKLHRIDSILERLELIPEIAPISNVSNAKSNRVQGIDANKVFIVHGHDGEARETVARFLEKLSLEAIVLHEQPNKGLTIIEKVERHSDVAFAVVLLTPDDIGSKKEEGVNLKPRARQNVILELGYFLGRLGRNHVTALIKGSVEKPSDFDGVVYVDMDTAGAWKALLGRELKASGMNVDLNDMF